MLDVLPIHVEGDPYRIPVSCISLAQQFLIINGQRDHAAVIEVQNMKSNQLHQKIASLSRIIAQALTLLIEEQPPRSESIIKETLSTLESTSVKIENGFKSKCLGSLSSDEDIGKHDSLK